MNYMNEALLGALGTFLGTLLFGGLVFGGLISLMTLLTNHMHHKAWSKVALKLGLNFTPGKVLRADVMEGRLSGYSVVVHTGVADNQKTRTVNTTVLIAGGLPVGLRLRNERKVSRLLAGGDIRVGESGFDWKALIRGDEVEALAVLTARGRELVRELLDDGGSIEDGRLLWSTMEVIDDPAELERRVRGLVKVVDRLSITGRDPLRRLASNARKDPVPGVRLRNLEVLLERAEPALAHETARACVGDDHPEVALRAALALGGEGQPHVERLVSQPGVPQALRMEALKALGAKGEAALIAMLAQVGVSARAAAQALEVCGTTNAVAPLMVHLRDPDTDPVLRDAVQKAVAAVQARAGVEAGGFAVVQEAGDQGAISLGESDQRGAVSLRAAVKSPGEPQR